MCVSVGGWGLMVCVRGRRVRVCECTCMCVSRCVSLHDQCDEFRDQKIDILCQNQTPLVSAYKTKQNRVLKYVQNPQCISCVG